jgi:hypothetical protein
MFAAALSALFVTLVTSGVMPAFATPYGGTSNETARQQDEQAPRGQDAQAPATLDDAQSPRSARS